MHATLNTDGGARGNPGPAGIGVVLKDDSGEVIAELARGLGYTTNNVAEYEAAIAGLELALEKGVTSLDFHIDSRLVVEQLAGRWKIRNDRLRTLAARAQRLMELFDDVRLSHVRRAHNTHADRLANKAMNDVESTAGPPPPGQGTFTE
jgi:ribonuclease H / adenosylcobalamin/alpha-ribazole phosphatase